MHSDAPTVSAYLKSLPVERAQVIKQVRNLINKNLPAGYRETMRWGMISWEIPLSKYPDTYNKQPLSYCGLAAQKGSYSLYLMGCYADEQTRLAFVKAYASTNKSMNLGKGCIRFKRVDDLPLALIAKTINKFSVNQFIKIYERARHR